MGNLKTEHKISALFTSILLVLTIILSGCSANNNNTSSNTDTQDLQGKTIGIAWRADADSEFYTNVFETLQDCGANPVMLKQVKSNELTYEGDNVASTHINPDKYLNEDAANIIKTKNYTQTNIFEVLDNIDHIIFTGGEDVSPTLVVDYFYPKYLCEDSEFNATRDVSDYLLMSYCLDHNLKIMGICRGMQMLGICSGAPLIQNIPGYTGFYQYEYNYEHRNNTLNEQGYRDYTSHEIDIVDNHNLLYDCYQSYQVEGVPSWHHQALMCVERTHLRQIAKTTTGGLDVIEGIQRFDKDFALGIQFHPEASYIKHKKGISNANNYMSSENALKVFKMFCE